MKRYLHYLALPLILVVLWMLLNEAWTVGQLVLGTLLALFLNWLAFTVRPLRATATQPLTALKLIWHVAVDIFMSNLAVGRIVWLGKRARPEPGYLKIPLKMTDPHGLAALACIVTYTPGTVWSDYSEQDQILTLHVLDLQDEAHWTHVIQHRYERPLIRIFE